MFWLVAYTNTSWLLYIVYFVTCRLAEFRELLASERIDVTKLGQLCFEGFIII